MAPAKSTKTTLGGLAAGLGMIGSAVSQIIENGWSEGAIMLILSGLGMAVAGFFARDDDVSSEGKKVKKGGG